MTLMMEQEEYPRLRLAVESFVIVVAVVGVTLTLTQIPRLLLLALALIGGGVALMAASVWLWWRGIRAIRAAWKDRR